MKGKKVSEIITYALKDIHAIKNPSSVLFQRNNDIRPFENTTSLEFLTKSSDCSLFALGSHSKKKPHCLTLGRMFDFQPLDIFEFTIDEETFVPTSIYEKHRSPQSIIRAGTNPCFLFVGDEFEHNEDYKVLKNFLLDFFHGTVADRLNLALVSRLICVAVSDKKVYFRHYAMVFSNTASRAPHVKLEEVGPHMDLIYRRRTANNEDLMKSAMKQPKYTPQTPKLKKNEEEGLFNDKVGKLHMDKQDLGQMATAKMKGFKKRKTESKEAEAEPVETPMVIETAIDEIPEKSSKKRKTNRN